MFSKFFVERKFSTAIPTENQNAKWSHLQLGVIHICSGRAK